MSDDHETEAAPVAIDRMTGKPADSRFVEALKRSGRHLSPEYIEGLEDSLNAAALLLQRGESGRGGTSADVAATELQASHRVCHTGNRWEFNVPLDGYPHSLAGVYQVLHEYQLEHGEQYPMHRIGMSMSEDGFDVYSGKAVDLLRMVNKALLEPLGLPLMDENLAPDVAADKGEARAR